MHGCQMRQGFNLKGESQANLKRPALVDFNQPVRRHHQFRGGVTPCTGSVGRSSVSGAAGARRRKAMACA